jgi:hypothetical protein
MHSPIYILEIHTSSNPLRPGLRIYTQGINFTEVNLSVMCKWFINRVRYENGIVISKQFSDHFIAFQRLWRAYYSFLRRVRSPRFLRLRETTGLRVKFRRPPIGTLYVSSGSIA